MLNNNVKQERQNKVKIKTGLKKKKKQGWGGVDPEAKGFLQRFQPGEAPPAAA